MIGFAIHREDYPIMYYNASIYLYKKKTPPPHRKQESDFPLPQSATVAGGSLVRG